MGLIGILTVGVAISFFVWLSYELRNAVEEPEIDEEPPAPAITEEELAKIRRANATAWIEIVREGL